MFLLVTVWAGASASAAPKIVAVDGQIRVGDFIVTTPGGWATVRVTVEGEQPTITWSAEHGDLRPGGQSAFWIAPESPGAYEIEVTATEGSQSVTETIAVLVLDPPLRWVANDVTLDEASQRASWALGATNTSDRAVVKAELVAVLLGSSGEVVSLLPDFEWNPSAPVEPGDARGVRYRFPDDRVAEAYATILNVTYSDGTRWDWTTR